MPFDIPALRAASWNIRSLLHHLPAMASPEPSTGTPRRIPGGYRLVVGGAAGGVAILVRRFLTTLADRIHTVELVPRRVIRATLTRGDDRLDLVNIHNEGLTRADRAFMLADFRGTERLRRETRAARLLCGGDFNFDSAHTEVTHITAAGRAHTRPRSRDRDRWTAILAKLLEVSPETEMRFAPASVAAPTSSDRTPADPPQLAELVGSGSSMSTRCWRRRCAYAPRRTRARCTEAR